MRRFLLTVTALLFSLVAFSQSGNILKDAQDLFAAGNYSAAVTKFQEAVNKLSGRDRNIAQLQLATARTCVEALSNAKTAESVKDYDKAIAEYQKVVDANPNDTRVKGLQETARRLKREANPTLSVSENNLSFSSSGGTQTITVSCSMNWTLVDQTTSMCSVSKSGNIITVNCAANPSTSSRTTSFTIRTTNGYKEQRISISQTGRSYSSYSSSSSSSNYSSSSTRLTVKQSYLTINAASGTFLVDVETNANDYSITLLPSWCTVKSKYKSFFSIAYTENTSTSSRSDWFNVSAGGKTVRVHITQKGKPYNSSDYSSYGSYSSYGGYSPSSYYEDKSVRMGLDASMDVFLDDESSYDSYYDSYDTPISFGIGLRARVGRYDQLFNLIGGVRYVFGSAHYGFQIPVLLNMNVLRSTEMDIAMYLGAGFEYGTSNSYLSGAMLQCGFCGMHYDLSMYYKPNYGGVFGMGFSYYF